MKFFILNLPALVCAVGAVVLSVQGNVGWGWFLFASVILAISDKPSK